MSDNDFLKNIRLKIKEKKDTKENLQEKSLVSFLDSLKEAEELEKKYEKDLDEQLEKLNEDSIVPEEAIKYFIGKIPLEIKKKYLAHGVVHRGRDPLSATLNIMANKSLKGTFGEYGSMFVPWDEADFLIVSKRDQNPFVLDDKGKVQKVNLNNEFLGHKIDIGAIVINTRYYPLVEELKKRYPDVNIIKANQVAEYFK
ncbi:MAG: hypothetical protein WC720_05480 [Candidatus Shapirobacteria bacterium]|jgi:hypothetical protein